MAAKRKKPVAKKKKTPAAPKSATRKAPNDLAALAELLRRVPAIGARVGTGHHGDGNWWVKLTIDLDHPLAWSVVQELGHILNYVALDQRLPTVFMPVSPPPYMNGGPRDFLSWLIESKDPEFTPAQAVEWLVGRLPKPLEDPAAWDSEP